MKRCWRFKILWNSVCFCSVFWFACVHVAGCFYDQDEEVTLYVDPDSSTLTPPTQQGDASGGSSPGQAPAEPITQRKASDVSTGFIQTLEEKEEEEEEQQGPIGSMTANWVLDHKETFLI